MFEYPTVTSITPVNPSVIATIGEERTRRSDQVNLCGYGGMVKTTSGITIADLVEHFEKIFDNPEGCHPQFDVRVRQRAKLVGKSYGEAIFHFANIEVMEKTWHERYTVSKDLCW